MKSWFVCCAQRLRYSRRFFSYLKPMDRDRSHESARRPLATGSHNSGPTRAFHDASIAAIAVGSGVGVHFTDEAGPVLATAGVLAAAVVSRYAYGGEIERLRQEVQQVQSRLDDLFEQVQTPAATGQTPVPWAARVGHEIRSPLSAVVALGDLLDESELNPRQRALVQDIRHAGQLVLGLVNNTLDLAKAEAGHLALATAPFNLRDLCERVARTGQALATDKPQLTVEASPPPLDWVEGDELRLQQVLVNLVSNAVKFSAAGGVRITTERLDQGAGTVALLRLTVSDQGPGLDEAVQARLFQPYSRAKADALGENSGTGLGLYLCRQIVEQMGGSIGVNSLHGRGAQFWFTVPVTPVAPPRAARTDTATPPPQARKLAGARLQNLLIAVVDDARLSREVALRIVEAEGATALSFASAEDFLAHLQGPHTDLDAVLMDLELTGMNGFAACRELRKIDGLGRVPVIAVSGTDAQSVALSLQESGIDGHVLKPFHAETLVDALSRHFD